MDSPSVPDSRERSITIEVLVSVLASIAIVTTFLRLFVRGVKKQLGWDDYCIGATALVLIPHWVFIILECANGYGRHITYLSKEQIERVLEYDFITQAFLYILLTLPKCSICLFILRIKNSGWLRYFLIGLMTFLVIANLQCFIILFAQCSPVSDYWKDQSACWNPHIYNSSIWAGVAYSIFSDLSCSLLPIAVLWNVQMRWRLKIAVSGLMSLGLVATAGAVARAYYSGVLNGSKDSTWNLSQITIWAMVEIHFAAIGANFALSRYVYLFFRDGARRSGRSSDVGGTYQLSEDSRRILRRMRRGTEQDTDVSASAGSKTGLVRTSNSSMMTAADPAAAA